MHPLRLIVLSCLTLMLAYDHAYGDPPLSFKITLSDQMADQPVSGRLFVFLSQQRGPEPRLGPNWFHPEPFFGTDIHQMVPGDPYLIDDRADGFPGKLSELEAGKYRVQALMDHDFYCPSPGLGVGNFYSDVLELDLNARTSGVVELVLNRRVEAKPFPESKWVKQVVLNSKQLETFHGHPVVERAAVILPPSYYEQTDRRYPVLYVISGFGGTLNDMVRRFRRRSAASSDAEVEMIQVLLSGECKWGHHVYANSATNGPRGDTLTQEMIPLVDQSFRTVAASTGRFVSGHSSGGWSSLWLQVNYPDTFGGVWSSAPDPVDFRDFQQVNLYANPPLSLYFDQRDRKRPLARRGKTPFLWYQDFANMDDCLCRGGQLRSFEAVFSPLDENGLPTALWDRTSGRIDPQVAESWKSYDINLILRNHWESLEPKLQGKIHVVMGDLDTFYLEGATKLLKQTLAELGSDAEVEILAGKDHGTVLTRAVLRKQREQMAAAFLKHHHRDGTAR